MRILIGILAFFSFGFSTAFATSIVAVRNSDEIVIGADSKTMLTSAGSAANLPVSVSKCKIVQVDDLFFASAGTAGVGPAGSRGDVDPEFDLKTVIAEGLRGQGGIAEKVGNMEKLLVAKLRRIAEEAKTDNDGLLLTKFTKSPAHTIIVGGLENGEPVLMVRTFRLVIAPSGLMSFEIGRFTCPGDCQAPDITIFEGRTGAIRRYLKEHCLYLHYADSVAAVRDLVGLEISEDPSSVGPPIDILRLTKKGAEWIQRKSLCPDIKKTSVLRDGGG